MVPEIDGTLRIRTGMNLEENYTWSTAVDTTYTKQYLAYTTHEWKNAGGDGSRTIIAVQRGRYVYFYDSLNVETSSGEYDTSLYVVDLNTYKSATYTEVIGFDPISTASANGKLLICSVATDPIVVSYTASGVSIEILDIGFRDFQGLDDGYQGADVDTEPTTLTAAHNYNLLNQGWRAAHITSYYTSQSTYPSNSQQWFLGKDTDDNFDAPTLVKQEFGKSQAPRGHYILDAFTRDRGAVSGLGVGSDPESHRFEACAFYAGRAWFAGVPNSDTIGSWIFFSQVVFEDYHMGQCYQNSDPTSEEANELAASDGGVIVIQGMGAPRRLLPLDRGLLVFADNGVWMVSGDLDAGFSADAYQVTKITTVPISGPRTAVAVQDMAFYWSDDGIWQIAKDQNTGHYAASNITQTSIASRYALALPAAREKAKGVYFLNDKTIFWGYQASPDANGELDMWQKDTFICLDLRLGAWYTMTINPLASNSPYIYDFEASSSKGTSNELLYVIDSALADVVDSSLNYVAEEFSVGNSLSSKMKFFVVGINSAQYKATWANFEDGVTPTSQTAKFRDWYAYDTTGITYTGYAITGYDVGQQPGGDRKINSNYVHVIMKRTETGVDASNNPINDSSVKMSARWDFTDDDTANKWSTPVEVYRHPRVWVPPTIPSSTYDDGYPIIVQKYKLRGRGWALQMKWETTADKDFKLVGWSSDIAINVD